MVKPTEKSDHLPPRASPGSAAGLAPSGEIRLHGIPVSPGIAMARVCMFSEDRHSGIEETVIAAGDEAAERERLHKALQSAKLKLEQTASKVAERLGKAEAEIFTVQQTIMEDENAQKKILALIDNERINAEAAVMRVFTDYEKRFSELSNDYMRERAGDIGEAKRRLLDALTDLRPVLACEGFKHCRRGRDRIIAASELSPSLTVDLDTHRVRGFVTERGGATSHAAILARALGIPSVSGVEGLLQHVSCGINILINGDIGEVILRPGPQTLADFPNLKRVRQPAVMEPPLPDFAVMANLNLSATVQETAHFQPDGIGLYRTEFEHIAAGRLLTENEQYRHYVKVLQVMAGKPVFFRLLDMGGDKGGDLIGITREDNPSLGLRGARLLLRRPDLLNPHLKALARAAEKAPLSILYPMIVDLDQFLALRKLVNEALEGRKTQPVRHGVMFEVPSACLMAGELLQHADFGSIGTNDLAQYLFAADRDNEHVVDDLTLDRPVFWKLIAEIVSAAQHTGKPLSVCGEMASDNALLIRLYDLGLRSVSVNTQSISRVRQALKHNVQHRTSNVAAAPVSGVRQGMVERRQENTVIH